MSSDTVFGQGTPPDPRDETYLSLLKKSIKPVKVVIKKEEEKEKDVIHITKDDKKVDPSTRPSIY